MCTLRPEQEEIVASILKRDVFAIHPTWFGKSACFQCLPSLFNKVDSSEGPFIVAVVTPGGEGVKVATISRYLYNFVYW